MRLCWLSAMKVMMTGATGLLGNELGKLLVEHGHDVLAVTRYPESARAKLAFPCQLTDWNEPHPELPKVQALIHLAGEGIADHRWTAERKKLLRSSRIETAA